MSSRTRKTSSFRNMSESGSWVILKEGVRVATRGSKVEAEQEAERLRSQLTESSGGGAPNIEVKQNLFG